MPKFDNFFQKKDYCFLLALFIPFLLSAQIQMKDTVCVKSTVIIGNAINTASGYYWGFCQPDINTVPAPTNLGNVNNKLAVPAYIDYAFDNGNYYGFLVNNSPGGLVRLDFGNSVLNTPTAVLLGNFSNKIPDGGQGIQVVKEGNNWYAIMVGGDPGAISTPKILKADFGTSLANTPTVTDWGNIGNMGYPHQLYLFKNGTNWYGLVANYRNSTITRFNFGTDFSSAPVGINLGNVGNLNGPTGIYPVNNNGSWYLFATNFDGNTLSRIDFGNSLLNTPTGGVNLGNPGGYFVHPRDLIIVNTCSQSVAYIGNDNADITRVSLTSISSNTTPTAVNMGKIGGAGNIHSISKIFRSGADLYMFLPNSYSNNLTRWRFAGCTNASIASSTAQTPGAISYDTPGTYTVSLTVDDGLPSQVGYCKQITVITKKPVTVTADTAICSGNTVTLSATGGDVYEWLNSSGISNTSLSTISVKPLQTTGYQVKITNNTCQTTDTLTSKVTVNTPPVISVTKSNDINCSFNSAQLGATGGSVYQWSPGTGLSDSTIANPVAKPSQTTKYYVTVSNAGGCTSKDSVTVSVAGSGSIGADQYLLPSAFTPNGDGVNDCFGVKQWGNIGGLSFSIYNRWGEKIFFTNNSANCWDGRYKGYLQPPGTYVYHVILQSFCGEVERKGTVVLIR